MSPCSGQQRFKARKLALAALSGAAFAVVAPAMADVAVTPGNLRVAFDHVAFDPHVRAGGASQGAVLDANPTPPSLSGIPFDSKDGDSAFYSARGLAIRTGPAVNPGDGTPAVGVPDQALYTSWLHGYDARWITEHNLADLSSDPVSDHNDLVGNNAVRLTSEFFVNQFQPKSLAIDSYGAVYAPIVQGGFTHLGVTPPPVSDIFIYQPNLQGSIDPYDAPDSGGLRAINVGGDPMADFPLAVPEGVTTFGARNPGGAIANALPNPNGPGAIAVKGLEFLYVTSRSSAFPAVMRYDITLLPAGQFVSLLPEIAPDTLFGGSDGSADGALMIPGADSLRGITTDSAGNVFVADRADAGTAGKLHIINDPGGAETITTVDLATITSDLSTAGISPHHLTVIDVGGTEVLVMTDRFRLVFLELDKDPTVTGAANDPTDNGSYQVIDFFSQPEIDDILADEDVDFVPQFGQIDFDPNTNTLYWTFEDRRVFENIPNGDVFPAALGDPDTPLLLDLVQDQILSLTLDNTIISNLVASSGSSSDPVSTPEPGTLAGVLLLGSGLMGRRRRKA